MAKRGTCRILAGLLCTVMLFLAIPVFTATAETEARTAADFTWGYTGKNDAKAGAFEIEWFPSGFYSATEAGTLSQNASSSRNFSYSERFRVSAGMKIWWTDEANQPTANEAAALTFWADATTDTAETTFNYSAPGSFASQTQDGYGVFTQSKLDATNGITYSYFNNTSTDKYVTVSAKEARGLLIDYSIGEPEWMGEYNAPLPRELVEGITWTSNTGLRMNGASSISKESPLNGYILSSAIEVKKGETIVLFADRALNAQTGADPQYIDVDQNRNVANAIETFAVYTAKPSESDVTASYSASASQHIGEAKITVGPITNTNVVVYSYTNTGASTVYVRVTYCSAAQYTADNLLPSNVYRYAPIETYNAITSNTGVTSGYYTNVDDTLGTTLNQMVKTPAEPPKVGEGIFMAWKVQYTQNSVAKVTYYPPETTLQFTLSDTDRPLLSGDLRISAVYLKAPPTTHGGASLRTAFPTGLQFKLYYLKEDYNNMNAELSLNAGDGGTLSLGAFTVSEDMMTFLLNHDTICSGDNACTADTCPVVANGDALVIKNSSGTAITAVSALSSATLNAESQERMDKYLTLEFLEAHREKIATWLASKYAVSVNPATLTLANVDYGKGLYINEETADEVSYLVNYYTLRGSERKDKFVKYYTARSFLTIRYDGVSGDNMFGEPVYGAFKTTNVRSTEQVLLACMQDTNSSYTAQKYFTETPIDMNNTTYGTREITSLTYFNGTKNVTVYTRRFSGATIGYLQNILNSLTDTYAPRSDQ